MGGVRLIAGLHMQTQRHLPPGRSAELIAHLRQITGDQREEIGRLRVRVIPDRLMAIRCSRKRPGRHGVAIAQQHRELLTLRFQSHAPAAEHIRTIRMEADAAEPFGFTLRGQHAATGVKPLQGCVVVGVDPTTGLERERLIRQGLQREGSVLQLPGLCRRRTPINCQVLEAQIDAAKHQGSPGLQRRELHPAGHQNVISVDDDIQGDLVEPEGPWGVVRKADRSGGCHGVTGHSAALILADQSPGQRATAAAGVASHLGSQQSAQRNRPAAAVIARGDITEATAHDASDQSSSTAIALKLRSHPSIARRVVVGRSLVGVGRRFIGVRLPTRPVMGLSGQGRRDQRSGEHRDGQRREADHP